MDLHIADPERSVDPHLRIEEVGTGMAVVQSHIDHLHRLPVRGGQWGKRKQLVLPDIVEKFFHEAFSVCLYRGSTNGWRHPFAIINIYRSTLRTVPSLMRTT